MGGHLLASRSWTSGGPASGTNWAEALPPRYRLIWWCEALRRGREATELETGCANAAGAGVFAEGKKI